MNLKNFIKNIVNEVFSENRNFSYNSGDCDVYAIALHRLTGYPIYVFRGKYFDKLNDEYAYEDCHLAVKTPDEYFFDSNGKHSEENIKSNCYFSNQVEDIIVEPISEEEAKWCLTIEGVSEDSIQKTVDYIKSKNIINEDFVNEINDDLKSQIEVIYKDSNLICLVPKTQKASNIYGKDTKWCQITRSGFNFWTEQGLLIRFLFKDGTKIRFTYYFEDRKEKDFDFYWSPSTGQHLFHGKGNPFDFSQFDHHYYDASKRLGKSIISKINQIPKECQDKVLKFIEKNKQDFDYCFDQAQEYKSHKEEKRDLEIKKQNNLIKQWIINNNNIVKKYDTIGRANYEYKLPFYITFPRFEHETMEFIYDVELEEDERQTKKFKSFNEIIQDFLKNLNFIEEKQQELFSNQDKMVAESKKELKNLNFLPIGFNEFDLF